MISCWAAFEYYVTFFLASLDPSSRPCHTFLYERIFFLSQPPPSKEWRTFRTLPCHLCICSFVFCVPHFVVPAIAFQSMLFQILWIQQQSVFLGMFHILALALCSTNGNFFNPFSRFLALLSFQRKVESNKEHMSCVCVCVRKSFGMIEVKTYLEFLP